MVTIEKRMIFFVIIMIIYGSSKAEVYKVGDSSGWTSIGHVDYKSWSRTKNFHVGDTILFKYNKEFHNVVRVTHKNFNSCNATTPYTTFTSGNDSFNIRKTGHYYFICSVPGHCQAGQRVDIRVPGTPSPAPTPTTPVHPSVEPVPSPDSSLSPSPSPSPAPGPNAKSSSFSLSKGLLKRKIWIIMLVLSLCF